MKKRMLFVLFMLSSWVSAAEPVSKHFFTGVAIGGQDTVAYHEQKSGAAVDGNSEFTFEWQDAKWRFASQASLDKFAENPAQWVPEFNGHCANALSLREGLVKTDGSVWQFFDDKLYLFYAQKGLARWQQGDYARYREDAEAAWNSILSAP